MDGYKIDVILCVLVHCYGISPEMKNHYSGTVVTRLTKA